MNRKQLEQEHQELRLFTDSMTAASTLLSITTMVMLILGKWFAVVLGILGTWTTYWFAQKGIAYAKEIHKQLEMSLDPDTASTEDKER